MVEALHNDSLNDCGACAGLMLISPKGHKITCALMFGFKA